MTMLSLMLLAAGGGPSGALTVIADNVSGFDGGFAASGPVVTFSSPGVNVTGGVAPYTYLWSYQGGSPVPGLNDAPSQQNPSWGNPNTPSGLHVAVWRVTVTDALGATGFIDIEVTLEWSDFQ